jgi:phosphomannomutase
MALDFVGPDGRPLSKSSRLLGDRQILSLNRIEAAIQDPYPRATRQAGPYRSFRAKVPYEAGLWKHFQALCPLRVCLASGSRLVAKTLKQIHETLPGELLEIPLPKRKRNPLDPDDPDVISTASAVKDLGADVGVLIDDDGQRLAFFDEEGQLLSVAQATRLIAEVRHGDCPNEPIVLEDFSPEELESLLKRLGMRVARGGVTMAQMSDSLRGHHGSFGGGASGRYWFREAFPTSDAIIALAAVLKFMSRADAKLSELV